MDLYKNWDTYAKQYNIDKFYDVDKKQFLKELTNFSYSFAKYFNTVEVINKLEKSVDNLQIVDITSNFGNWKKVYSNEKPFVEIDNKYYIVIWKGLNLKKWNIVKFNNNNEKIKIQTDGGQELWKFDKQLMLDVGKGIILWNDDSTEKIFKSVYRWDENNEPTTPEIDSNGDLKYLSEYYQNTRSFLLKYIDVIVQENIRVHQGGNPDYDDPNLGSQRIIFDFEIINNLDRSSAGTILTKKSIYRMILTIDEKKNIIAGSLELTHLKQYLNGNDYNSYRYTDDLGFLFSFMKDK